MERLLEGGFLFGSVALLFWSRNTRTVSEWESGGCGGGGGCGCGCEVRHKLRSARFSGCWLRWRRRGPRKKSTHLSRHLLEFPRILRSLIGPTSQSTSNKTKKSSPTLFWTPAQSPSGLSPIRAMLTFSAVSAGPPHLVLAPEVPVPVASIPPSFSRPILLSQK